MNQLVLDVDRIIKALQPKRHLPSSWGKADASYRCAPSCARFQRVKVPNPPGSGKDIAEGKGVHREVESEGSWMWGTY